MANNNGVGGRAHWSNRMAFVLAAAGSAVGLGNIWKFPYIAGVNGGGAFVLIYLVLIAVVGIPILIAEIYIGQVAQKNAVEAFEITHRKKTPWRVAGILGVVSAFLILSFYSVVGGWVFDYVFKSAFNEFIGRGDEVIKGLLAELFHSPWRQIFWHAVFMLLTAAIVAAGIKRGIQRWSEILMPALVFILLGILIYTMFMPGFPKAVSFLFSPDTSKLTPAGILEAAGHSFFTLSLGLGAMITYGSYLSKKENIVSTAVTVAVMDTVIALMAGLVTLAVVFSYDLEAGKGPTLMFQTLPLLFAKLPGGYFISLAFFLLVAFAALTSAMSLLEVVVSYWTEVHKMPRRVTTWCTSLAIFSVGILSALSTNVLGDVTWRGKTCFDILDKFTSSFSLPFGGAIISLFYGWVLGPKAVQATLKTGHHVIYAQVLLWTTRLIAPILVILVLLNGLRDF